MHRLMLAWLALLISVSAMAAVVPGQINYQGFLTAPDGSPLDTVVNMTFRIYPDSVGGLFSWSESHNNVPVTNGLFTAHLGETTALSSNNFWRDSLWLGVTVGSNSEMTPRIRFLAVPYSYRVGTVDYATGGSILSQVFIADKANIGSGNTNAGTRAFVAGQNNVAAGDYSTVGGGYQNTANGSASAIVGGQFNTANGYLAFVGGGDEHAAGAQRSVIAGGYHNSVTGDVSVIAGGELNTISAGASAVGGGQANIVSQQFSVVAGGRYNRVRGQFSVVAGGGGLVEMDSNSVVADYGAVCGGRRNYVSNAQAFVGGGFGNQATGNSSAIAGGAFNKAAGSYSLAVGRRAKANHDGSFVWGDSYDGDVPSDSANSFTVRASGGIQMYTNTALTAGVQVWAGGGSWSSISDSTKKRNIRLVDTRSILEKVARLPIKQWSYRAQDPSIEHVGPMAQDFWSAFHVGEDSLGISTLDPDGIALAAIQELHHQNQELQKELTALRARVQTLEAAQQQSLNERSNHE